jgi:carbon monoxide dehydrogenase subunit G
MDFSGKHTFYAPRDTVYHAMTDPVVLRRALPACRTFDALGGGFYSITLSIGIGIIKGNYTGKVQLLNEVPPESFTLRLIAKGSVGAVRGQGNFQREPEPDDGDKTLLTYAGDAQVQGKMGFLGHHILRAGANLIIGQFLSALDTEVNGKR